MNLCLRDSKGLHADIPPREDSQHGGWAGPEIETDIRCRGTGVPFIPAVRLARVTREGAREL